MGKKRKRPQTIEEALADARSVVPKDPTALARARKFLGMREAPATRARAPKSPQRPLAPVYLVYCLGCRELCPTTGDEDEFWCQDCLDHDPDHHELGGG